MTPNRCIKNRCRGVSLCEEHYTYSVSVVKTDSADSPTFCGRAAAAQPSAVGKRPNAERFDRRSKQSLACRLGFRVSGNLHVQNGLGEVTTGTQKLQDLHDNIANQDYDEFEDGRDF